MGKKSADSKKLENWDYLDNVHSGVFVIDREFRVLKANKYSHFIFGDTLENIHPEETCYNIIFSKSARCDDCPIETEMQDNWERSFIINKEGDGIFIKETAYPSDEVIFLTFQDNINENFLQHELDSIKNELVAKNILLNRYRTGDKENRGVNQIIDNLSDALVTIDGSMNIRIINSKAKLEFPAINVSKCYELFGGNKPCDSCPVNDRMSDVQDVKTSHYINGKFFTEVITGFKSDEGCLLLFRDNTRQIDLIEQIRSQNETINRKNDILSSLVKLEAKMQGDKKIENVLEYFFDLFLPLYQAKSIILIVNDIRVGSVWFTIYRGVSEKKVNILTHAYFSRDIHTINPHAIPEEALPWKDTCQVNLVGRNDKLVGMVFVEGKGAEDGAELIDLFKDPLAAYIHNIILLKLLKERAETDSLTGLYNRRYLERAMEQENTNLEKYGINHSVVVVDVNGLKYVNDTYGHEAGDNMITFVALNLLKSTRETDVIARTGGDEFVILLTNTDEYGAGKFRKRFNDVFNELYITLNGKQHMVTVSSGFASSDTCPPDKLIKQADKLMYENKKEFYKIKLDQDGIKTLKRTDMI